VFHARSPTADDGLGWDTAREVEVTRAVGTDDWVPSLAIDGGGALTIAMARNTCPPPDACHGLALTRSVDGGDSWSAPAIAVAATATVEHHLPALAVDGAGLALAWTPYDRGEGPPWAGLATGAHVAIARSADGTSWSAPADVTARAGDAITLFPTLYADHAGRTQLAWMTAGAGGQTVVSRPLADTAATPAPLPIDGYSPRVVATATPGVYLAAWVAGPAGERDVFVRVFAR
jgi:hypothetical protein